MEINVTCVTDSLCCTAESDIVKKLYFNKNRLKLKKKKESPPTIFNLASLESESLSVASDYL